MNRLTKVSLFVLIVSSIGLQFLIFKELRAARGERPSRPRTADVRADAADERPIGREPVESFTASLQIDDRAVRGERTAKVALVEFGDYQCPFCRRFLTDTWPDFDREYVQSGKVQVIYRNLPLAGLHKEATEAAIVAECAGRQGRFWDMHDALLANGLDFNQAGWNARAEALSLDLARLKQCRGDRVAAELVERDAAEADRLGLSSTPAFLVGRVENGQIKVSVKIKGAQKMSVFRRVIDSLLAGD